MRTDKVEVIRWSDEQLPDEGLLRSILADEDLNPYVWSNRPGDVYGAHSHSYHKVIYVIFFSVSICQSVNAKIRKYSRGKKS